MENCGRCKWFYRPNGWERRNGWCNNLLSRVWQLSAAMQCILIFFWRLGIYRPIANCSLNSVRTLDMHLASHNIRESHDRNSYIHVYSNTCFESHDIHYNLKKLENERRFLKTVSRHIFRRRLIEFDVPIQPLIDCIELFISYSYINSTIIMISLLMYFHFNCEFLLF